MKINETLIEKYFSKQLSEAELLEFEKEYQSNADFKEEIDFLKSLQSVSETEDNAQFKTQLTSYEAEFSKKPHPIFTRWLKPLIAVAAILIVALSYNLFMNKNLNHDALYTTYFEPSKNVSAPIVRSDSNDKIIHNAFIAYSEADYKQAIPLFDQAFQNTQNSELLFYKGNSLLALNETDEAIDTFKKHLSYSDILTNRTHWYLALAYLKKEKIDEAKQELYLLINSAESFKRKEATSLLKKLD